MKCKCGHEKGSHGKDGVCWKFIDSQGVYCWCSNFTGKPKSRRRAKPFRRWAWDRENEVKLGPDGILFDGELFVSVVQDDLSQTKNVIELVRLLNRARVILPKRRRS